MPGVTGISVYRLNKAANVAANVTAGSCFPAVAEPARALPKTVGKFYSNKSVAKLNNIEFRYLAVTDQLTQVLHTENAC